MISLRMALRRAIRPFNATFGANAGTDMLREVAG